MTVSITSHRMFGDKVTRYANWLKRKELPRAYVFKPEPGPLLKRHCDVIELLKSSLRAIGHKAEIIEISLEEYQFLEAVQCDTRTVDMLR